MVSASLLLVEDDREIRALLEEFLNREGFSVQAADSAAAMDRILSKGFPDLIILDLMLPGEDGLSACRRIRARSKVPILMLTAKTEDIDRILGLEMGADDYLGKPFNPRELLARIRAILRRSGPERSEDVSPPSRRKSFAGLTVDLDGRVIEMDGERVVHLTTAEFDLLVCFLERPRRVLSREQLLDWTRGRGADPFDRTIDVTVSRLRTKLGHCLPDGAHIITTVRNAGYLLTMDVKDV